MTSTLSGPPEISAPPTPSSSGLRTLPETLLGLERHLVLVVATVAVLVRLPFLASDPSRDEAGFLLVGQQWHAGGSSLYGDYWVDRPPLLITIFRIAAQLGGLVPLRLIGCLATALVVLGVAYVARRLGGARAAVWAAVTAAALCVSPAARWAGGERRAARRPVRGGRPRRRAGHDRPAQRSSCRGRGRAGRCRDRRRSAREAEHGRRRGLRLRHPRWWRGAGAS